MNVVVESTHYAYARGFCAGNINDLSPNPYNQFSDVENAEAEFYRRGFNDGSYIAKVTEQIIAMEDEND